MISSERIWEALRPRLMRFVADTDNIELIRRHTECELATIGGWLTGTLPYADKLIRVWYLLDALGYDSPEMLMLDELQLYVGRVYAFGLIDMQDLRDLLEVTNPQTAIQFLRGQASMKLKPEALPGLREKYDVALSEYVAGLPKVAERQPESQPVAEEDGVTILVHEGMDQILLLATLIGAALPLARRLVESGTAEQRSALRKAAGHPTLPTIFTFSAFIEALCSEDALRKLRGAGAKA